MKLNFTLLFVLFAFFRIDAYSQTYYQGDVDALKAIKQSCDKNNSLNWSVDVPVQNWEGVMWWLDNETNVYRLLKIDISNKKLTGKLEINNLAFLNLLNCQNNMLIGLDIKNCLALQILNCKGNQLSIMELLKYLHVVQYAYNPQQAIFDEQTQMPGYIIDYSSQADGGNTKFVFRNRSKPGNDGSEIVAVNNTGICPTKEDGVYFCEMVNPKLTQNGFYSHTSNTIISNLAITMKTELPVGSEISFIIEAINERTPIQIDFGDGVKIDKIINHYPSSYTDTIKGIVGNSQIIKIYGPGIARFECKSNRLIALDVSNCLTLRELGCSSNNLTTLDVTHNTSLDCIWCYYNKLTELDISKCLKLEYINLSNNQISSIDLTNNSSLIGFYAMWNQFQDLDISKNTSLAWLDCMFNKITQ